MSKLAEQFEGAADPETYAREYGRYMAKMVSALDSETVAKVVELVESAATNDATVFVMGNGGSAAVGGHWVNDLGPNSVAKGQPGFRIISLTDNAGSVTAIGNDTSFEEIFAIQLKSFMRPGDVVLALSVSGASPNIVRGVEYANEHGAVTVGCCGMDGGRLKDICQHVIHVPSSRDEYGPVEDAFSVVMHMVTTYLTMKRGRMLEH